MFEGRNYINLVFGDEYCKYNLIIEGIDLRQ